MSSSPSNSASRYSARRRGTALVLGILIIIALLGLAGLVIDLGMARVTQAQMQSAADSAALEAMRNRDELPAVLQGDSETNLVLASVEAAVGSPRPTPFNSSDAEHIEWLNAARRVLAQRMIDAAYPMSSQSGAGPVFEQSGGVVTPAGGYRALNTITVPDDHVYRPALDINLEDSAEIADMAAGTYARDSGYPNDVSRDELIVGGVYRRRDFTPRGESSGADNAFLVRLRRTAENSDPRGGPLPYLFGPGSLVNLSQFANGISVRAPAIAAVGRAKTAGPAFVSPLEEPDNPYWVTGLAPFAFDVTAWTGSMDLQFTVSGGVIRERSVGGSAVGYVLQNIASLSLSSPATPATDNNAVEDHNTTLTRLRERVATAQPFAYVPLVDENNQVVAFGFVDWSLSDESGERILSFVNAPVEKIGSGNVSTIFANAIPDGTNMAALLDTHNQLDRPFLLAPALVNRHLGPQTQP